MPYTVFPLHAIDANGSCVCSEGPACLRPGKHPAIRWGELAPGEQVHGSAGHGIATGIRSDVFVVDTDGPEADARFRALGPLPDTYTVTTPSGGRHYYFAHPGFPVRSSVGEYDWREDVDGFVVDSQGKKSKRSTCIDVRGEGGMVVTPGSPHKSGRTYAVETNVAPVAAPAWLLAWEGLEGRIINGTANAPTPVDITTPEGARRVELGREACTTMAPSIFGENGSGALWNLSLRMIRDLQIPLDVAHALVAEHYNPRCDPAWSDVEIDHKLTSARDKSDRPCGIFTAGFVEGLVAQTRQVHQAKAAEVRTRRRHDPAHTYPVLVGQNSAGEPAKTLPHQVRNILWDHHAWDGVLAFDELRGEVVAVDPPTPLDAERLGLSDEDGDRISNWFAVCEVPMSVLPDIAYRAAVVVAKRRSFNPIREYLEELVPEHGAIEEMARDAMGLEDEIELTYVRKFLIAAVRRALRPGTKVDTALTLFGERGLRKSTFVKALFTDAWSSDCVGNIEDEKGVGEKLAGKWCVELAELKSLQGASLETVLAFLSRQTDRFRGAYKRGNAKDHPRTCVFVGTTNETDILRNASGADARRFWIAKPSRRIDTTWIAANRDAVWGEAMALAATDEAHWLSEEEEEVHYSRAEQFQARDPHHESVVDFLIGKASVTPDEVFRALGGMSKDFDRKEMLRVIDTLRRIGCERVIEGTGLRRVRRWRVPATLTSLSKLDPCGSVLDPLKGSRIGA